MIGIVVVTHGKLGEALLESASMFVSDNRLTRAVSFFPGEGVEDLMASVRTAVNELRADVGVLALVDLPGGSPARAVGLLLLEKERMAMVSGVNLPMLVEVLMLRDSMTLSELADYAVQTGTEGIVDVGKRIARRGGDPER